MLHTLRRLGVREAELEDTAHDVFSTAWKRLDTWDTSRAMRPWLFGIAFKVVSNQKAARTGKEELFEHLPDTHSLSERPDEILEGEMTRQHVLAALEQLPLEQRALFVGHDIEKTPITELAETFDIPLNTAYSRLRLARQRFENIFAQLQEGVPS
jgi:RNA polymerase sigma-70 factor (ECF subfamily)